MRALDNVAVLVPYQGMVEVFLRRYGGDLHFNRKVESREHLYDALTELLPPRIIVLVGSGYSGCLEALLAHEDQHTTVLLIPGGWMRHIPVKNDTQRARCALQFLEAHINEPIRLLHAGEGDLPL